MRTVSCDGFKANELPAIRVQMHAMHDTPCGGQAVAGASTLGKLAMGKTACILGYYGA